MKCKFCYLSLILFIISCADSQIMDECSIDKGLDIHRELSNLTKRAYKSIRNDTVRFCNSQNQVMQFQVSKSEGERYWGFSYQDSIENCEFQYTTHRDYHSVNYNSTNESQNISVKYYTSGYTTQNNNVDSLIALYDLISFSCVNASTVGAYMIDRNEGLIIEHETPYDYFFTDQLKVDTIINNVEYDTIYILPNDVHENLILYSIQNGIIQFEHNK